MGRPSLLVLLPLALIPAGCISRPDPRGASPALVVRRLQLEQRDAAGRLQWTLQSPGARYDISQRRAEATGLSGTLYVHGQPRYRITGQRGLVIDDGTEIRLDTGARIATIEAQPLEISAGRMRWWPRRGLVMLEGNPQARQGRDRLRAREARFLVKQEKLELTGAPSLEHHRPPDDRGQGSADAAELRLLLPDRLDWMLASGSIQAPGPVRGERRPPRGAVQTFEAADLRGNSRRRMLLLGGPIRFHAPGDSGELTTGDLQADLNGRNLSSRRPLSGRLKDLKMSGDDLQVNVADESLLIGGCRLQQPSQQLTARTCRWQWRRQIFQASGDVVLRRREDNQTIRSEILEGQLGRNGWLVFRTPQGRVRSQLLLRGETRRQDRRPPLAL